MRNIQKIVEKIFIARDFQIVEESNNQFNANRGEVTIAVYCIESTKTITHEDIQEFLEIDESNIHRKIIVTDSRFDYEVHEIIKGKEILLWDIEKLEIEIGKAVLKKGFDFFIPQTVEIEKTDEQEKIETTETTINEEPLKLFDGEIIQLKIQRDKAEMIAKKFVHPISFELRLVPYFLYDYECEFLIAEDSLEKTAGTVGINGVTEVGELWFNFDFTDDLEIQHKKIIPHFDLQKALKIAKNQIIELNTKSVESTTDKESVMIIQKKKIKPKQENIKIQPRGMVHLPLWVVGGTNGKVVIDAVSGDVSDKKLFVVS